MRVGCRMPHIRADREQGAARRAAKSCADMQSTYPGLDQHRDTRLPATNHAQAQQNRQHHSSGVSAGCCLDSVRDDTSCTTLAAAQRTVSTGVAPLPAAAQPRLGEKHLAAPRFFEHGWQTVRLHAWRPPAQEPKPTPNSHPLDARCSRQLQCPLSKEQPSLRIPLPHPCVLPHS